MVQDRNTILTEWYAVKLTASSRPRRNVIVLFGLRNAFLVFLASFMVFVSGSGQKLVNLY